LHLVRHITCCPTHYTKIIKLRKPLCMENKTIGEKICDACIVINRSSKTLNRNRLFSLAQRTSIITDRFNKTILKLDLCETHNTQLKEFFETQTRAVMIFYSCII